MEHHERLYTQDWEEKEPTEADCHCQCESSAHGYSCSMKVDRVLTPLIKLVDCYNIPLEVNLVEKAHLGYWIQVAFEDADKFYKMFQDVDFYEKWDEMSLNDIILHKPGMPLEMRAAEIKKALDAAVKNLHNKKHADEP